MRELGSGFLLAARALGDPRGDRSLPAFTGTLRDTLSAGLDGPAGDVPRASGLDDARRRLEELYR